MTYKIINMRIGIVLLLFFINTTLLTAQRAENIIIVTTDGFRWQELFTGMDSAIANNAKYNEGDSAYIFKTYWAEDAIQRRKKLLPFIWSTIESKGQLLGNRTYGNHANVSNPYWFSYPGYSEIFCGFADTAINSNSYPPNPNETVLEYLHKQKKYKNHIAAFGAWDAFDRILNEKRSGIPVVCGFKKTGGIKPTASEQLLNKLLADSYRPWGEAECLDVFTHHAAMEHLKTRSPKILYIAYGETDEWAHAGKYRSYLDATKQVDKWIGDIWNYVQTNPMYKNKTALIITTDHGRGDAVFNSAWTDHNNKTAGSDAIWMAFLGAGIAAKGELKNNQQVYQKQIAVTIAALTGFSFIPKEGTSLPIPTE